MALLAASVLVAALLGEVVLRWLPAATIGFEVADGRFRLPLEYDLEAALAAHRAPITDPPPKPSHGFRVVLLGDSYVAAVSVPESARVGARIAAHLRKAGVKAVEVLAWGKGGWSPRKELATLRRRGALADPDLVVTLFLTLNDVRPGSPVLDAELERQSQTLPSLRMQGGSFPVERALALWVPQSRLNQLLSHRLTLSRAGRKREGVPVDYWVYAAHPSADWLEAWQATERILLETRAEASRLGAGYALVSASTPHGAMGATAGTERLRSAYPALAAVPLDLDAPDRRLAAFASREQIPFLALERHVRAATRAGAPHHWRYDGHWNAAGNDLAGRTIAEFLLGASLVPNREGAR